MIFCAFLAGFVSGITLFFWSYFNLGITMEYKILIGIFCAFLAIVFAIGALGLALGIGPVVFSLCIVAVSGAGLFVVSGLLGE